MEDIELIQIAEKAKEKAYVPYSHFKVGAALMTSDKKVYTGCNVENASFGATNCAERTAVFKAVSEGDRDFEAIAIVSSSGDFTYPCGICRQVISEFNPNIQLILANNKGEIRSYRFNEIFPFAFTKEDIK